jgi:hypothetical protein
MKHLCDSCKALLYETAQTGSGFDQVVNSPNGAPIVVVVGQKFQAMFCSRTCAARWFLASDESSLRSGYPV